MEEERRATLKILEFMQTYNKYKFYTGYKYIKTILQKIMTEHYKYGYSDTLSLRKYHELYFKDEITYVNLAKTVSLFLKKIEYEGNFKLFITDCYEQLVMDPLLDADVEGDDEF